MAAEAREAPARIAEQTQRNAALMETLAAGLRRFDPLFIATCARGSSDHAAAYAKYLFETRLGLATASFAPSVASVYGARVRLDRALFVSISQSGQSPDLVRAAEMAKAAGARVVAIVNVIDSPLARAADVVVPLHAGAETSVAATKSCLGSMAAAFHLCAAWRADRAMSTALAGLPAQLDDASGADWSAAIDAFVEARQAVVVSRGLGLAAAQEAALKLKETCRIQAEAFSAAEVRHGPMAIVGPGVPTLAAATGDAANESVVDAARRFAERDARVFFAGPDSAPDGATFLPTPPAPAGDLQPLVFLQAFYLFANRLSLARGLDPDKPNGLRKVTRTI